MANNASPPGKNTRSVPIITGSAHDRNNGSGSELVLQVKDVSVDFIGKEHAPWRAVDQVSFNLHAGEVMGLVGESGCGKTTLMLSLMRLLSVNGRIVNGEINLVGRDLLDLSENEMADVRWKNIAMIFQGAMNALNPVLTVGEQIIEALLRHHAVIGMEEANRRVAELFDLVGMPPSRSNQYPFQFSGGMRQRVMIAMALACSPPVVIADEPTTALDVMIQAQILELLLELRKRLGMAVILVTHDLGVIAELCDSVLVMYGGVAAEYTDVDTLYNQPAHPYTQNLLKAFPDLSHPTGKLISIPGYPPRIDALPPGCRFAPRCPQAFERCHREKPPLYQLPGFHQASCFLYSAHSEPHQDGMVRSRVSEAQSDP